ncbi:MAG: radical SAM family heme chaperone HemW [Luminiphilus sp.]|nr:radical SAM family heme chaperone HemW [Luminiphilus sp.]
MTLPPLSLYIHIPWCEKKCPYCDFNSHERFDPSLEQSYLEALKRDLAKQVDWAAGREIATIFIGGGTPSLFSGDAIADVLDDVRSMLPITSAAEITLESNPGSRDAQRYAQYREAGINRLSIGIQSFDEVQLKTLGRIHSSSEAFDAIGLAQQVGFERINIDLMHGLPGQSPQAAVNDVELAISTGVSHISWYQLTIERNTAFWSNPPTLPVENEVQTINEAGYQTLQKAGFAQYEVSAWAMAEQACLHNLNYWQFGDYLAIGAGAHGKVTAKDGQSYRFHRTRAPDHYMAQFNQASIISSDSHLNPIPRKEQLGEFMMNALRLKEGFEFSLVESRLGMTEDSFRSHCHNLLERGLLTWVEDRIAPTPLGYQHLDTVIAEFI